MSDSCGCDYSATEFLGPRKELGVFGMKFETGIHANIHKRFNLIQKLGLCRSMYKEIVQPLEKFWGFAAKRFLCNLLEMILPNRFHFIVPR